MGIQIIVGKNNEVKTLYIVLGEIYLLIKLIYVADMTNAGVNGGNKPPGFIRRFKTRV